MLKLARNCTPFPTHVVAESTNITVTPTEDGANASAYLILVNTRGGQFTIGETSIYEDTLVKTKDGWKLAF